MRCIKQVIAGLVLAVFLFAALPAFTGTAEGTKNNSGDYQYSIDSSGGAVIEKYLGNDATLTVPGSLDGFPVKEIGESAFANTFSLDSITLPEGLQSIGKGAFFYCSNLRFVVCSQGLQSIGEGAFAGCDSLRTVVLPEGLQSIAALAFSSCRNLTDIAIPDSLALITGNPFGSTPVAISVSKDHPRFAVSDGVLLDRSDGILISYPYGSGKDSYSVPKEVRTIGKWAFSFVPLSSVELPEGLLSIDDGAFAGCQSFSSIELPKGLQSIGSEAFFYCKNLSSVVLPEELQSIGKEAFYTCTSLASLVLPKGLQSIGDKAFSECPLLTLTVFPDSYSEGWAKENEVPYQYPD